MLASLSDAADAPPPAPWQRRFFEMPPGEEILANIRAAMHQIARQPVPAVSVAVRGDHPQLEAIEQLRREFQPHLGVAVLPVASAGPVPPSVWVIDHWQTSRIAEFAAEDLRKQLQRMRTPIEPRMRGPRPLRVILDEITDDIAERELKKMVERPSLFIDTTIPGV